MLGVVGALCLSVLHAAPSVYWVTNPNLPNETVVIAGAFISSVTHARWCRISGGATESQWKGAPLSLRSPQQCESWLAPLDVWNHSVKVTMPSDVTLQTLQLCHGTGSGINGDDLSDCIDVAVNAPDILWAAAVDPTSVPATDVYPQIRQSPPTVRSGGSLRIFGRGLAWDTGTAGGCIHAATRSGTCSTVLTLPGHLPLTAVDCTCFEVTFEMSGIPTGTYPAATLTTTHGATVLGEVTVLPPLRPAPSPTILSVDTAFHGNVAAALARASELASTGAFVEVVLGAKSYSLTAQLTVPNNTLLVGQGPSTKLSFSNVTSPPGAAAACGTPLANTDMYFKAPNGSDIAYIPNSTLAACCASCIRNPACNAYSMEKSEGKCILKRCIVRNGCATNVDTDRTSAWLAPYRPEPGSGAGAALAAIATTATSTGWTLANFTLEILGAPAKTPAILAQGTHFRITGLSVVTMQDNVSNALKVVSASHFEVGNNLIAQRGVCLWPPHSPHSDFSASVTILFQGATSDGWIHHNQIEWKCAAFDLDTDNRIVFEDNGFRCTENGTIPHGNSVSTYNWAHYPSSRFWSFARNAMTRPDGNDPHNWSNRETLTTDGSGGWGAGPIQTVSTDHVTITLNASNYTYAKLDAVSAVGATAVVVSGPGLGQFAIVAEHENVTTLRLDTPFDSTVVPGESVVAVISSSGYKLITGNTFSHGMVIQFFGDTLVGVIADNTFIDDNVCSTGYGCKYGDGALEGWGLCYGDNGVEPLFYAEYTGNTMDRSNGITFRDGISPKCAGSYEGPYVRWQMIRRNSIGGVSRSNPGCGTINATFSGSSDIVAESNSFECPPGVDLPGGGVNIECTHCVVHA